MRAETTSDPLWTLLSTYVLTPDEKAAAATGEAADAKGLAALQADLLLLSEGFEAFRDESQVKESLVRLEPRMSPELKPFFKDRASSLDAVYRTLAVTDYTWATRFPDPPCEPSAKRRALMSSRDGLFQTESGEASPWLVALLGPQAEGRSAEEALDKASTKTRLSAADYEKRRAAIRRLTLALTSEKAEGAARSKLYCARAAAFSDLAAHHRSQDAAPVLAARVATTKPEESVFIVVWGGRRAAATLLQTKKGPVLVTDADVADAPTLFAYAGRSSPVELKTAVLSRHTGLGLAVLSYSDDTRPALSLAASAPAKDDLVTALGHTEPSGLWTKTSGLVTKSGETSFQTDAAISTELTGGPVLNESGEVVGLLVGRPADTEEGRWPVAVPAPVLARWLDNTQADFAAPQIEAIQDAGTAAILNRTNPAPIEAGLGAWNIPAMGPPPPTPRGVCVSGCNIPSAPSRSYSGGSSYSGSGGAAMGQALGEAMAPLVQALVFQGIPALFRGIGNLFKKKDGAAQSSARAQQKSTPVVKPPPPPKPKPLKPSGIRLSSDRLEAAPREVVKLIATVLFTGDEGSRAGIAVTFSLNSDKAEFPAGSIASTDSNGVASVSLIMKPDMAAEAHEDLERESRINAGEKVAERILHEPPANAKPASKVEYAANKAADALDRETENSQSAEEVGEDSSSQAVDAGMAIPGHAADASGPKLRTLAPPMELTATGAGFTARHQINGSENVKSDAESKICEEARSNADAECGENRDCSDARSCADNKDIRGRLIKCQFARLKAAEECGTPEDKNRYTAIRDRVRSCGRVIASRCCPQWTKALEALKNSACNRGGCSGVDSCAELMQKLAAARECKKLRRLQAQMCYDGIEDAGHKEAVDNVDIMIADCEAKLAAAKAIPGRCVDDPKGE